MVNTTTKIHFQPHWKSGFGSLERIFRYLICTPLSYRQVILLCALDYKYSQLGGGGPLLLPTNRPYPYSGLTLHAEQNIWSSFPIRSLQTCCSDAPKEQQEGLVFDRRTQSTNSDKLAVVCVRNQRYYGKQPAACPGLQAELSGRAKPSQPDNRPIRPTLNWLWY